MEKIIDKILGENFDYDNGSLDFSCSKLEIRLLPGEDAEGEFQIFGTEGKLLEGEVFSSDFRMECLTPQFAGNGETIRYHFSSEGMEEGDVIKGEFFVISNQGEYYLPFVVSMGYLQVESSMGPIKNLFHFANLAKMNSAEALNLFYSPQFQRVFAGNETQYHQMYLGLSAYSGSRQNMEEFLISINKKQKIEYLTEEKEIRLDAPEDVTVYQLNIIKNGWGYVALNAETEGDFLYVEKSTLSDDDFLGNYCTLPVYIDSARLHSGKNIGSIRLYNSYDEMVLPVIVTGRNSAGQGRHVLEKHRLTVQLMEYYQAFRMKKISTSTWLKETGKLVEKLTAMDTKDLAARMFQAHLLITEERNNEANWILDHVASTLEQREETEPVLWAYYLYLTTLLSRDESYVDKVTAEVKTIYKKNRRQWRIAWLLLYLSEEYSKSATKKLLFLEEQFHLGCTSPVLYIEALTLLNANPALLMKMGEFERQVLLYASQKEFLNRELVDQAVYLIGKQKEYSENAYRFLTGCYAHKADDGVLQEICAMLIKGGRVGSAYFPWYEKGVERELRITRLYEYYMMSIDLNYTGALPKMVLMYFSYQSNLDYERNAFLYANVYRNREEFPNLYESYREHIEQFITEQILKQRINRDLAYLYRHVLAPRMLNKEVAEALSRLLFVHEIRTEQKEMRQVIVYQPMSGKEHLYPMTGGRAYVPLFGNECMLLFEDGQHNRYAASVSYTMEKLMIPGKLVQDIAPLVHGMTGYDVYRCMNGHELAEVTPENETAFFHLLEMPEITAEYKTEAGIRLLHYYYENDQIEILDEFLDNMAEVQLSAKALRELLKFLVIRGKMQKAYEMICKYGPYQADPKVLMRLCSYLLQQQTELTENKQMTAILIYVFRKGKYDEHVLRYLTKYYRGMARELRDIWKAAEDFQVNTRELSERMLIQMLFTGSFVGEYMEVFRSYVRSGAAADVENAFLTQCAYDYFVKEKVTESFVFEEMFRLYRQGEEMAQVSKLAFLKYYAENKEEMTENVKPFLKELAAWMMREKMYLKFMAEYGNLEPMTDRMRDKTIVEYRAHPGARVVIHYVIEREEGEDSEYLTEEMQQVYGGVCFRAFTLFFGEGLQYYIVEEMNGEEQLTESGNIRKNDIAGGIEEGKFDLLNDIVVGRTLQDYETVDQLLEEYYYKDYMCERLFKLM